MVEPSQEALVVRRLGTIPLGMHTHRRYLERRGTPKRFEDLAQLAAIRAGFGIGICQVALARRDRDLVRVLPEAFEVKLGTWLAMHENLRSTPRCRIVFDALAAGLKGHVER